MAFDYGGGGDSLYEPEKKPPARKTYSWQPTQKAASTSDQANVASNATGTSGGNTFWQDYYGKMTRDASGEKARAPSDSADRYSPVNVALRSTGLFAMNNPINRSLWDAWQGAVYDPTGRGGFGGRNSPLGDLFSGGSPSVGSSMAAKSNYYNENDPINQQRADAMFRNQWRYGEDPNLPSKWSLLQSKIEDPNDFLFWGNPGDPNNPNPYYNPYEEQQPGSSGGWGGSGGGGGGYSYPSSYSSPYSGSPYSSWYRQLINWRI